MIKEYNGSNIIENGLLYFYSSWISSCNMYNELNERISNKFTDLDIMRINTTKYYSMKEQYNIKKIPSYVLIKNNANIAKLDGMTNQYSLINWINENRG